jgi:hypothetical protein
MAQRRWLGLALAGLTIVTGSVAAQTPAQEPAPTFKAKVSSIPMDIWIKDKTGKPRLGLTAADLTFKIDGKVRSFAFVSEVADKPGDRDGKDHSLEISVRGGGTLKRKLKLPKES